jgi:hypothetical protein
MNDDSFDSRTLTNMAVALERACDDLPVDGEEHRSRRYIANKIVQCAEGGDRSLDGLTEAGRLAASKLSIMANTMPPRDPEDEDEDEAEDEEERADEPPVVREPDED